MNDNFPDDLKEFAVRERPLGKLFFYQEIDPDYVEQAYNKGWYYATAVAAIVDCGESSGRTVSEYRHAWEYGVIPCLKRDGEWMSSACGRGLLMRALLYRLKALYEDVRRRELDPSVVSFDRLHLSEFPIPAGRIPLIQPLPLLQELGIND